MLSVHGTYPMDSSRWRQIREVQDLQEVADLLKIEVEPNLVAQHNSSRGNWSKNVYLWLNKGYIVIGVAPKGVPSESFALTMVEMFGGSPEVKNIEEGAQALYLHDGAYYLIERAVP